MYVSRAGGHGDIDSLDSIEVVSRARRPLLPYGAMVLEQVIRAMRPSSIVISALGVREGLLYDLLSPEEAARIDEVADRLRAAAARLAAASAAANPGSQTIRAW